MFLLKKIKKSKICTNTCTKKTHSLKIEFWPEPVFFVNFNVKHPVFLIKGGDDIIFVYPKNTQQRLHSARWSAKLQPSR